MQQDPDQAEKGDDKASTGGMFSLEFNFLSSFENGTDTLKATTDRQTREFLRWNLRRPSWERTGTCQSAALRAILKMPNRNS